MRSVTISYYQLLSVTISEQWRYPGGHLHEDMITNHSRSIVGSGDTQAGTCMRDAPSRCRAVMLDCSLRSALVHACGETSPPSLEQPSCLELHLALTRCNQITPRSQSYRNHMRRDALEPHLASACGHSGEGILGDPRESPPWEISGRSLLDILEDPWESPSWQINAKQLLDITHHLARVSVHLLCLKLAARRFKCRVCVYCSLLRQ